MALSVPGVCTGPGKSYTVGIFQKRYFRIFKRLSFHPGLVKPTRIDEASFMIHIFDQPMGSGSKNGNIFTPEIWLRS